MSDGLPSFPASYQLEGTCVALTQRIYAMRHAAAAAAQAIRGYAVDAKQVAFLTKACRKVLAESQHAPGIRGAS